jgi:hypothetical protein
MPTLSTWLRQPIQIPQTLLRLTAQVRHRMRLHLRSRADWRPILTQTIHTLGQVTRCPERR